MNYRQEDKLLNIIFNTVCESISVCVSDISGKTVFSGKFKNAQNLSLQVPAGLSNGVYIVKLNYDGKEQIEKMIM